MTVMLRNSDYRTKMATFQELQEALKIKRVNNELLNTWYYIFARYFIISKSITFIS